ncbi:hypothetical protein [Burkholderia ubonensis]|uniref:hypothetical protein n=1 Tax=Burkholderia ubonensis TaxID=101571 RepID=UPI001056B475|nr:hypothetical protein [Burkholderia ubonensis]
MAAILDVWIAKPGDPCYVDDREWFVNVLDANGNVYHWSSKDYANLQAPHGHWADSIPPGCYIVQAQGRDDKGQPIYTDHAIVEVGCEGYVCVRLFVADAQEPGPRPRRCEIQITEVTGIGSEPTSIQVSGTAVNCKQIDITVHCRSAQTAHTVAAVTASGHWTANLSASELRCKCGRGVFVKAFCVDDPNCVRVFETEKLSCTQSNSPR